MLEKYGLDRKEAQAFCLIQMTSPPSVIMENGGHEVVDGREYYLEDDECPLAILMNHPPSRGTYHVAMISPAAGRCDSAGATALRSGLLVDNAHPAFVPGRGHASQY